MRIGLLLALLLTAGCPFSDEDGDGSRYVVIDDLEAKAKTAQCTYLVRCGLFPDQATCESANVNGTLALDPNLVAAIKAGRVNYNGSAMFVCLDGLASATCDKTDQSGRAVPSGCTFFLRGTVAGGEACILDEECISQTCSGGVSGTECIMGTCIGDIEPSFEPALIGMPCTSFSGCVDGAYCDTLTDRCLELKDAGVECTSNTECGYGFACGGTTGARTCQTLPAKDQPCPENICRDEGLYCSPMTSTCQQVGLPPATCTSTVQCSPYYPCDNASLMCKQTPALGQSCSATNRCFAAGTFCDTTTFTCAALLADGMPCGSDTQCQSDNCDFNSGLCEPALICF